MKFILRVRRRSDDGEQWGPWKTEGSHPQYAAAMVAAVTRGRWGDEDVAVFHNDQPYFLAGATPVTGREAVRRWRAILPMKEDVHGIC